MEVTGPRVYDAGINGVMLGLRVCVYISPVILLHDYGCA